MACGVWRNVCRSRDGTALHRLRPFYRLHVIEPGWSRHLVQDLVTAFVSLFVGTWVAARLSTNTAGSGRLHGPVTWGLTTMATFAFTAWIFWGALNTSIAAIRTATVATNTAAANTAAPTAQSTANNVQSQAANAVNQATQQAPNIASTFKGDASTLDLRVAFTHFSFVDCHAGSDILDVARFTFIPAFESDGYARQKYRYPRSGKPLGYRQFARSNKIKPDAV